MPSPVGHALAGLAAGWLVAGGPPVMQKLRHDEYLGHAAVFAALGTLPDIDLLFGAHSGPTHSLGAAALVCVAAFAIARALAAPRPERMALACAAAYASHVLLDWLGRDSSPPIGVMALWPLSREYFESAVHVFMPISRRYHQGWTFVVQNALAVCLEILILVPILVVVARFRRRRVEWENV